MNTFFLQARNQSRTNSACRIASPPDAVTPPPEAFIVAIGHHLFHQLFNGNLFAAVGIPGIAVVAIEAAHQAALEEGDKANPRPSTVPQDSKE